MVIAESGASYKSRRMACELLLSMAYQRGSLPHLLEWVSVALSIPSDADEDSKRECIQCVFGFQRSPKNREFSMCSVLQLHYVHFTFQYIKPIYMYIQFSSFAYVIVCSPFSPLCLF